MLEYLNKPFQFMGKERNYHELKRWENVKIYENTSHFEQKLLKDEDGNLFFYRFDEYVNFNGGDDEINELFIYVEDEKTADQLSTTRFAQKIPYVHVGHGFIRVYE